MIETDKRTKKLLSDPEIFAEIFNHLVFQSDNVLLPENLTPMDSRESLIEPALELYRDVKMKAVVSMKDRNGTAYLILAAENQSSVDRTIPVRTMGYDYLEYRRQLEDMVKHGRKGYLTPVITVVIPWFHTTWKKPRTLHDMFDPEVVEQFKDLIPDYKPVFLMPRDIPWRQIRQLNPSLQYIFGNMKAGEDYETLEKELNLHRDFQSIDRALAEYINEEYTMNLPINEQEGDKVNMCLAQEQWIRDHHDKFVAEGREEERKSAIFQLFSLNFTSGQILKVFPKCTEQEIESLKEEWLATEKVGKA